MSGTSPLPSFGLTSDDLLPQHLDFLDEIRHRGGSAKKLRWNLLHKAVVEELTLAELAQWSRLPESVVAGLLERQVQVWRRFRPLDREPEPIVVDISAVIRDSRRRRRTMDGFHTEAEWQAKLAEYGGMCAYCGKNPADTRDHVEPVDRGGSDWISNIVPACRQCNSRKGTKPVAVFLRRMGVSA